MIISVRFLIACLMWTLVSQKINKVYLGFSDMKRVVLKIFNCNSIMKNRRGQIWIETVIYTMIAMVLIGIVLGYVTPKVEEFRDRTSIEKTLNFLTAMDSKINEISSVPGNKRALQFNFNKGLIKIDSANDKITFEIDSRYEYSESGETFSENGFQVSTEDQGKYKKVTISKTYSHNITYENSEQTKTISHSPTQYNLIISNNGFSGNKAIIDFKVN